MRIIRRSIIYDRLEDIGLDIQLRVDETEKGGVPFGIDVGCVDHWISDKDMETLAKLFTKAVRIRKAALKK